MNYLPADEKVTLELEDGRQVHLWLHDCESCTSLDVWTTRGNEVEEISAHTGDKSRAPMGLFAWRDGFRRTVDAEPMEGSHKWPAVGTVTLIWHD
jgi:hypothetical protein